MVLPPHDMCIKHQEWCEYFPEGTQVYLNLEIRIILINLLLTQVTYNKVQALRINH